ncbi:CPBP family intramembrane glutamic endopeptidase [uncultured Eubacterium sp.]|uniref:CPBP family intramembrane glutamic endopeptidase n=1 Tax=uncultured Eubacterium sp. TaxID=165185 RepID=UPI0025FEB1AC|nr:type II CAAX endopeptidase family protein [uncultured Eubacterium sp.]
MDDKRFFSRVGFSYFMMVVLTAVVQFVLSLVLAFAAPQAAGLPITSWLLSMVPLYLVGIPVCAKLMQRLPKMQFYQNEMRPGQWIRTLCICIFVMYVGNIIGNIVSALLAQGTGLDQSFELGDLMSQGSPWLTLIFSVILAPVMEELIFRKVLIDRTIVYGDKAAVVLSGLLFGIFQGNFHQFFYAFGLGCVFAYVYIRTGKLKYTISLHMVVNMLGGFLSTLLLQQLNYSAWDTSNPYTYVDMMFNHVGAVLALVVLEVGMVIMGIAGLIFFLRSVKKLEWRSGEFEKPFREMAGAMFGNPGMILFLLSGIGLFVMNML